MNDSVPLPKEHREFVNIIKCPLARAYAEICPHEYIVRDRVDDGLFVSLVNHIGVHGHEARLYRKPITCSDEDGLVYWTMGESVEFTTIVNRCLSGRTL